MLRRRLAHAIDYYRTGHNRTEQSNTLLNTGDVLQSKAMGITKRLFLAVVTEKLSKYKQSKQMINFFSLEAEESGAQLF